MMIYWHLFLAFFVPGIVGYGGGPPSIPLIQYEVVDHYEWMTNSEFANTLALGNALPGPIATKMAGYIGYEIGGVPGAAVALFATIAPSLIVMIVLMGILLKFKNSPRIKKMTGMIKPTIAILLVMMCYEFVTGAWEKAGLWHTLFLLASSYLLLERFKVHPAFVIVLTLGYGAFLL
ncbi:chromate transporter [Bacillus capparidis]|nr:chromate transporter [Bacillus capparidis]